VSAWAPVIAAITAAIAALIGYWLTYRSKQLDSKAEAYAKALTSIEAYKALPYRIRRRSGSEEDTAVLRRLISDVQQEVAFYRRWLALESVAVGLAFEALANKVMRAGADWREQAWRSPPAVSDNEIDFVGGYEYDDQLEQQACLIAMRRGLRRRRMVRWLRKRARSDSVNRLVRACTQGGHWTWPQHAQDWGGGSRTVVTSSVSRYSASSRSLPPENPQT
jgi:hypothetical protein